MEQVIKKHEELVESILEKYPKTRDDDFLLYAAVCQAKGLDIRNTSIADWAKEHAERGYPAFTSINRARLVVEERRPELIGAKKAERLEKAERIKEEMLNG